LRLKTNLLRLLVFISIFSNPAELLAASGQFLNPVTDICWNCIFPIRIGGIAVSGGKSEGSLPTDPQVFNPLCVCPLPPPLPPRVGIPISFWEPARIIETVKTPFYSPFIGKSLMKTWKGGGTHSIEPTETSVFAQAHYFIFPVWTLLEIFTDSICLEASGIDLAYITEVDPLWNNDSLAFIIQPESILFANLAAQMSCIADSVGANVGQPLSPLFWCMGSWGSAYPLTGHVNDDNYVQANAAIAARTIYKLARQLMICDPGINVCGCIPTPIWKKDNYKLQLARPVRTATSHPIGRSSLIWGSLINPPLRASGNSNDEFLWVVFRKRTCCVA
jgi:conjugal transfer pilus assembly protein TraU